MKSRTLMVGFALAAALAIPLAGCGEGENSQVEALRRGAGGTWNARAAASVGAAASVRLGASMCPALRGSYEKTSGNCEGIGLD